MNYSELKAKGSATVAKIAVQEKDGENIKIVEKVQLLKAVYSAETGELKHTENSPINSDEVNTRIAALQAEINDLNTLLSDIAAAKSKDALSGDQILTVEAVNNETAIKQPKP